MGIKGCPFKTTQVICMKSEPVVMPILKQNVKILTIPHMWGVSRDWRESEIRNSPAGKRGGEARYLGGYFRKKYFANQKRRLESAGESAPLWRRAADYFKAE